MPDRTELSMAVFALALLTAALALIVPIWFARQKPGYSHLRHTISELGEAGSPVERAVALYGFLPIGLSLWAFLYTAENAASRASDETFALLSLVGLAYVGAAFFRSDRDAPIAGSWRNAIHNIVGSLEYLGAAGAFFSMQRDAFWGPLAVFGNYAALVIFGCFAGIGFPHPYRGLVQRVAEATIFGGVVMMGWWIWRS